MKPFSGFGCLRIALLFAAVGIPRAVHAQSIETFDAPGSSATSPAAVNEFGRITGSFQDAGRRSHGFVRSPFGTFTTFDAPSPGNDATGANTIPLAINSAGQIAGGVYAARDGVLVERGFVRNEYGTITEFDAAPGALQTTAQAINAHGWIGGTYLDASYNTHGFVRSPRGAISTFDTPPSVTFVREIRPNGSVIGAFQMPLGFFQGFVREADGTVSSFEGPDLSHETGGVGCGKCGGTYTTAATPTGHSVGFYGATGHIVRGFLRKANGTLSNLDVPGAIRTTPEAINVEGAVAGEYTNPDPYDSHGFLLPRDGKLESFDVPDSYWLSVTAIDVENKVIGFYADASGTHGFIRKPRAGCGRFHF